MTSEESKPPVGENAAVEAGATPGFLHSLLGKIKLALLVLGIIVVECAIAYFWLPNVSDSEAQAAALSGEATNEEDTEDKQVAQIEVDLGSYCVTAYQPTSSTTMRIDFHLYGTIGEPDNPEFLTLKDGNDARLREQVNVIVRSADVSDLTDPTLGLIKRQILEKINRALGKPLLRGVVFSEFAFTEQ